MSINVKRFEKLIAVTEKAKPENFDMGRYGVKRAGRCGTPACVLGHYAADRRAQKAFKLSVPYYYTNEATGEQVEPSNCRLDVVDSEGNMVGFDSDAVIEHFGITSKQGEELFGYAGCGSARTPKQAVAYLRKFMARELKVEAMVARAEFKVAERAFNAASKKLARLEGALS